MGLAYPSDPNKELSFFNSAIESGAIKSSVFAFKLASEDSEDSELFLGGTNPSLYTGDFETHDAATSTGNYFPVHPWRFLIILFVGFWQITGASAIVGGNITSSGFDTMLVSALHCDLC
jgi:cathepsin D